MSKATQSTLLHMLELVVTMGIAIAAKVFLEMSNIEAVGLFVGLNTTSKFARANDAIPVKDFVNE